MDTHLKPKPLFEWFVVRCGSRTGHQKNMFWKIVLHAQIITREKSRLQQDLGSLENLMLHFHNEDN
jgi:hypothetical protein